MIGDEHVARRAVQPLAGALGAGLVADVLGQLLAHGGGFGFLVASFQVRHDALERVLAGDLAAALGDVAEGNLFLAAAVENGLLDVRGKLLPRRVDVEAVVRGQRHEQLEIVCVAPVPAAHRAVGQRQLRVADHARGVEHLGHAQAVAGRAGADRRVEREQPRLQLGQRVVADRAGVARGQQLLGRVGRIHVGQDHQPVAEAQRGLERFGQALLDVFARAEAIHHHLDGVLDAQPQRRHRVEVDHLPVDAGAHEALRAQLLEHLHVLALALAHHRRQQHVALFRVERERGVDHLADRLCLQRNAVVGTARRAHAGVQQAQVVVHLGDRAHGGARVVRGGFLLDRDRRRQAFDVVDVGLLHHRQELARVRGKRLHVAALAFGVDGVEGQRGFARTGQAGDHDQLVSGQVEVDVLEIVRACAADANGVHGRRIWGGLITIPSSLDSSLESSRAARSADAAAVAK